ncbi:unnamed protein product [Somion occarium]|uniref:Uncharacterized protein n=1 Tax=Somion occarium TaxID=3059160 RepID=A0ABP1DJC5_9APHY
MNLGEAKQKIFALEMAWRVYRWSPKGAWEQSPSSGHERRAAGKKVSDGKREEIGGVGWRDMPGACSVRELVVVVLECALVYPYPGLPTVSASLFAAYSVSLFFILSTLAPV